LTTSVTQPSDHFTYVTAKQQNAIFSSSVNTKTDNSSLSINGNQIKTEKLQ